MPIKGKFFPSQASGERVFLLIRRHWFVFAAMSLLFLVLSIPVVILIIYWLGNPETFDGVLGNFVLVFAGMYALAVAGLMLYAFVNHYLDVYIVTNKRIVDIKQNGFFNREIAELHLHQVQDVEARVEGFLQTMFHFGTIYIQTAGERENFVFQDVPHPYRLAKAIVELHEAQIEAEYEPKVYKEDDKTDDYRPEDYMGSADEDVSKEKAETMIDRDEKKIHELDRQMRKTGDYPIVEDQRKTDSEPTDPNQPIEEFGFGAQEPVTDDKLEQELKELSEGEEVSVDNTGRGL